VVYEITPTLSGRVLFEFMGPADVIDLLQSVEVHLSRLASSLSPPAVATTGRRARPPRREIDRSGT
jgi:hypothetical protein